MPVIGWVVTDSPQLGELWPESGELLPETLEQLLGAAYEQCSEYAPALAAGDPVPDRYPTAQIYQASEIWAAARREGDVIGLSDQVAIRVRPLGATVKSLLRPPSGVPRIG